MSLHEELATVTTTGCKVCAFVDGLSGADARAWANELALPTAEVAHQKVMDAMIRRGAAITEASVRRHRRNHASGPR